MLQVANKKKAWAKIFFGDGDRLAKGKTIDDDKEDERDDSPLYLPDSTTHVSLGTSPNNK